MSSARHILILSCANRPGIVAKVSTALFDGGFNILDAQQFDDTETGNFFMRVVFNAADAARGRRGVARKIQGDRRRTRDDLVDASGRPAQARRAHGLAFRPLPRRSPLSLAQRRIADGSGGDHRQLSARDLRPHRLRRHSVPLPAGHQANQDGAGDRRRGRSSNPPRPISSFWRATCRFCRTGSRPSCRGAASTSITRSCPASRARSPIIRRIERGVKLIGATAHFVTSDLDEGPIIEQDVERISHRDTPEDLVRKGRDIERRVLARAIANVLEDRVLLNQGKTVVFAG